MGSSGVSQSGHVRVSVTFESASTVGMAISVFEFAVNSPFARATKIRLAAPGGNHSFILSAMPATCHTIASYASEYLKHSGFPDYASAFNGLQLESHGAVARIGAAVDACESVIVEAVRRRVGLLLVHHGLMWDQHGFAFTGAR